MSLINSAVTNLASYSTTPDFRAYINLRKRLKTEDLVIVKADKGETLVLMERSAYIKKVDDFLKSSNAVEIKNFFN